MNSLSGEASTSAGGEIDGQHGIDSLAKVLLCTKVLGLPIFLMKGRTVAEPVQRKLSREKYTSFCCFSITLLLLLHPASVNPRDPSTGSSPAYGSHDSGFALRPYYVPGASRTPYLHTSTHRYTWRVPTQQACRSADSPSELLHQSLILPDLPIRRSDILEHTYKPRRLDSITVAGAQ